jgi:hypothetical protein
MHLLASRIQRLAHLFHQHFFPSGSFIAHQVHIAHAESGGHALGGLQITG